MPIREEVTRRFTSWLLISLSMLIGFFLYFRLPVTKDWPPFLGLAALTALNLIYMTVKLKKISLQAARWVGGAFPVAAALYLTQFHYSIEPNLQMFQVFIVSIAMNVLVHILLLKRESAH